MERTSVSPTLRWHSVRPPWKAEAGNRGAHLIVVIAGGKAQRRVFGAKHESGRDRLCVRPAGRETRTERDLSSKTARLLGPSASMIGGVKEIGAAQEAGDELIGRPVIDVTRRPHLRDQTIRHHRHVVGHGERFGLIVRDIERGDGNAGHQFL